MNKAKRLAAEKNSTGMSSSLPPRPFDPAFAILQDVPNASLIAVASDSGVLLGSDSAELLDLIRAKELAQAALAAAAAAQALASSSAQPSSAPTPVAPNASVAAPVSVEPENQELVSLDAPTSSLLKKRKLVSVPAVSSRPNLRQIPARQARVLQSMSQ